MQGEAADKLKHHEGEGLKENSAIPQKKKKKAGFMLGGTTAIIGGEGGYEPKDSMVGKKKGKRVKQCSNGKGSVDDRAIWGGQNRG